jgi:hypothetical protein
VDSTNADVMTLATSIAKTTAAWAVGGGNGSLDAGSIAANTWYHAHLIKRTDTQVVDVLTSLSASAPTLPSGYTLFRRIGSMKTDGTSQWTAFIQDGDRFRWASAVSDVTASNPGTAAVIRTLTVPTGVRVAADITVIGIASTDAGPGGIYLSDLLQADMAASGTTATLASYFDGNSASHQLVGGGTASIMTNTSAQIRSRCGVSATTMGLNIITHGWADTRGK